MNFAPAFTARIACSSFMTAPAPIFISGNSFTTSLSLFRAIRSERDFRAIHAPSLYADNVFSVSLTSFISTTGINLSILFHLEIRYRVAITNIFYNFPDERFVGRHFAVFHKFAKVIAQNSAKIMMPRIRQKRTTVR